MSNFMNDDRIKDFYELYKKCDAMAIKESAKLELFRAVAAQETASRICFSLKALSDGIVSAVTSQVMDSLTDDGLTIHEKIVDDFAWDEMLEALFPEWDDE